MDDTVFNIPFFHLWFVNFFSWRRENESKENILNLIRKWFAKNNVYILPPAMLREFAKRLVLCLRSYFVPPYLLSFMICAINAKTLFTFMLLFAVVIILRISYSLCFVVVIIFFLFHTWRGRINIISIKLSRVVTDAHEYWP